MSAGDARAPELAGRRQATAQPAREVGEGFLSDAAGALNGNPCQLDQRMGIEYLEASGDRIVARMPVEGNRQPFGLLHGGATIALCESVASFASFLYAHPRGMAAVGVDVNATHHRSATQGWVTATGTPIHQGRSSTSYEIQVVDDAGRRVCTSRITCFLREL